MINCLLVELLDDGAESQATIVDRAETGDQPARPVESSAFMSAQPRSVPGQKAVPRSRDGLITRGAKEGSRSGPSDRRIAETA
jgi:hypothetical protein